jgi:HEAT repeat protein
MKRRNKWLLAAAMAFVAIAVALFIFTPREPRHDGRPIGDWVQDLEDPRKRPAAEQAIRAMGPRAVPYLTHSLEQRNSASLRLYRSSLLAQKWLRGLRAKVKWHQPVMHSRNAATALAMLGPEASAAIPNLVAALNDSSPLVAQEASVALGKIGSEAAPLLIERLRFAPTNDTTWVIRALGVIGPDAKAAIPELARLTLDRGVNGDYAILTLARMGPSAIPAMTNLLSNTNPALRMRASTFFTQIGTNVIFATNALLHAVNDSNLNVRANILRALGNAPALRPMTRDVWLKALNDPAPNTVLMALDNLWLDESGSFAFTNEVAALLSHPNLYIRIKASNLLSAYKLSTKK